LVQLTRVFLPGMQARGRGYVLNVASTAAFQPGPTMAVYYASKAFVFSFTYALAAELAGTGVSATALCPGLTRSEFIARANLKEHGRWPMMDPRAVAVAGYRGMMRRKRVVVPGWFNRITAALSPCLPVRWTSALARKVHET
jgi:short-subunit dehydrogenase